MENPHCLIGKPSINGQFSMAVLNKPEGMALQQDKGDSD